MLYWACSGEPIAHDQYLLNSALSHEVCIYIDYARPTLSSNLDVECCRWLLIQNVVSELGAVGAGKLLHHFAPIIVAHRPMCTRCPYKHNGIHYLALTLHKLQLASWRADTFGAFCNG